MKKAFNCLLLALLIQIVAGCGNLNTAELSTGFYDSSIKTLTITAGDQSVSKTILPSALDCASLTYYFVIENLIYNSKNLQVFDGSGGGSSLNIPIELATGYYKISVYALDAAGVSSITGAYPADFDEGDLQTACVLFGRATVDLRQDETISISLTANSLCENGIVSLNFYTNGWTLDTDKFNATCYIKNKAGVLISSTGNKTNLNGVTSVPPADGAAPLYYESMPAGTYTLYVDYTSLADDSVVYRWTDNIMVVPHRTIKKNIALIDIIDHAPAAPSGLKASYYDVDPSGIYCYVNFAWTDNANNEAGFQMDLKAVYPSDDDALITSDMAASWEAVNSDLSAVSGSFTRAATALTQAFDDVPGLCVDGSLNKNNTSATFKLSRGVRYLARVRSVGYGHAGSSGWAYVSFTAGGTGKAGYSDFAADARYIKVGE